MTQLPVLSLNELLASLGGLTYMQLYYLSNTIAQIIPDEQAAMQFMRNQFALESQAGPVVTNEAANAPSKDQPPMGMIVKSILKLSQQELQTLGEAVLKRMQQLPSPFPKRDPESSSWGISYGLSQIFPEENFKPPQIEPPTEMPEWFRQVRALAHQAIQTLQTNPEEANQVIKQAITLAEQNHYPTFALNIQWEGMTTRSEHRLTDLFQEAVEFYRTQNDPFELAEKLKDWAFLQARIENREKALEILKEAEAILESLTPEALSETDSNRRVLFQNLIENEVLIRTKIVDLQRLRKQILSGEEVRGGYTIQTI